MWTYLAYILERYWEATGKTKVLISEIYDFHAKFLWMGEHLTFWEGLNDLKSDISYLEKLKSISTNGDEIQMINLGGLLSISNIVSNSDRDTKLYEEYRARINRAMNQWLKTKN
jgi:hypothetical protein